MFTNLRRMGAERAFAQVRIDLDALQRSVRLLLYEAMPDSGAFDALIDYEAYMQLIADINELSSELEQKMIANASAGTEEEEAIAAVAQFSEMSDPADKENTEPASAAAETAPVPAPVDTAENLTPAAADTQA